MTERPRIAALAFVTGVGLFGPGCHAAPPQVPAAARAGTPAPSMQSSAPTRVLGSDLDHIFNDKAVARAVVAARVDALDDGHVVYARQADTLVMPASNLKLVTMAVAADRLGWDFTFETRLETSGTIADGVLTGDLVVVGGGDPSIGSHDAGPSALLTEWAQALEQAGIHRVDGRIVGDDRAFANEPLGAGWAWDYLADGYAAPVSALAYNEDVAVLHIAPGSEVGAPATVTATPPGHGLEIDSQVTTGATGSAAAIELVRAPGTARLRIEGHLALGAAPIIRTAAVPDPTAYFAEAFRLALEDAGIAVTGGAWNVHALSAPMNPGSRRVIARHTSDRLSSLVEYAMKVSQNFYGEMIFRTLGRSADQPGSAEAARAAIRETLTGWGVAPDAWVMDDGSGLSRYDYVTATTLVQVLEHVWHDERLRGPFVAALPVGAHDGTLQSRMTDPVLDRRVQAKTGTITNVRALSGYLETDAGEKLAFSIIVNNVTGAAAEIDAVVDGALRRLVEASPTELAR